MASRGADVPRSAEPAGPERPAARGTQFSTVLLVSARTPEHTAVPPPISHADSARRADAAVEFIGYANAGLAADAATDDAWDVVFMGAEPARAARWPSSRPGVSGDGCDLPHYRAFWVIQAIEQVDRNGVRNRDRGTRNVHAAAAAHAAERNLARNGRDTGSFDLFAESRLRRAGRPEAAAPR